MMDTIVRGLLEAASPLHAARPMTILVFAQIMSKVNLPDDSPVGASSSLHGILILLKSSISGVFVAPAGAGAEAIPRVSPSAFAECSRTFSLHNKSFACSE